MRAYRLALVTSAAAVAVLALGGLMHPAGAGLACPDWPVCDPAAGRPGVLLDLTHRAGALVLAVLAAVLAWAVFRDRPDPGPRRLAVGAVGAVALQAALGALTVIFRLPIVLAAAHLAVSVALLALLLLLAWRLRPAPREHAPFAPPLPRLLVLAAAVAVYTQMVLGAFVRHAGAALACGTDLLLCGGEALPSSRLGALHMLHRGLGGVAVLLAVVASYRTLSAARGGPRVRQVLAAAVPMLATLQVAFGLLTVSTLVAPAAVSLHLLGATLLLTVLVLLYVALGPEGARARPPPAPYLPPGAQVNA
jgi:heme A synthase